MVWSQPSVAFLANDESASHPAMSEDHKALVGFCHEEDGSQDDVLKLWAVNGAAKLPCPASSCKRTTASAMSASVGPDIDICAGPLQPLSRMPGENSKEIARSGLAQTRLRPGRCGFRSG